MPDRFLPMPARIECFKYSLDNDEYIAWTMWFTKLDTDING